MFYSQFILAKKGPLGTIWIAAHLERKLRKNQVADTDIGVSVDSILFPDVPIALRLSSHLLLGVVRIYSRKVNYLFHDCSEALLKVKQAFRSTAVDLPPEESTAPYHSITLPETFDLDDFELPDSDIFQGSYVDHHVSTREQITLQDTMDGVVYSTSQFGLDERFGDGDTSQIGLDLDEDLFLHKVTTPSRTAILVEAEDDLPDASAQAMTPALDMDIDEDQNRPDEDMIGVTSETALVDASGEQIDSNTQCQNQAEVPATDLTTDTQAPSTSGISEADVHILTTGENGQLPGNFQVEQVKQQDESPSTAVALDTMSSDLNGSLCSPTSVLAEQAKPVSPASECLDRTNVTSDNIEVTEISHEGDINNKSPCPSLVNDMHTEDRSPSRNALETIAVSTSEETCGRPDASGGVNANSTKPVLDIPESACASQRYSEAVASTRANSEGDFNELHHDHGISSTRDPENCGASTCSDPEATGIPSDVAFDKKLCANHILRACSSLRDQPEEVSHEDENLAEDTNLSSKGADPCSEKTAVEEANRASEASAVAQGEECQTTNITDTFLEATVTESVPSDDQANPTMSHERVDTVASEDNHAENVDCLPSSELPAPEMLLAAPATVLDVQRNLLVDATPEKDELADDESIAEWSKTLSGRKRRLMETTPVLPDGNPAKLSGLPRSKRTLESIPDDDDLLSSILVGRNTSVLKLKPTPVVAEIASSKRQRVTTRANVLKRKVLLDDNMVLHGDTIRQQLTDTEDIRRVRRKAPCTLPEIWVIQKQLLEDEMFNEPLFTGMAADIVSLLNGTYDPSEARFSVIGSDRSLKGSTMEEHPRSTEIMKDDIVQQTDKTVVVEQDGESHEPAETAVQPENQLSEEHVIDSVSHENKERIEDSTEIPPLEVTNTGGTDMESHVSNHEIELPVPFGPLSEDNCNVSSVSKIDSHSMDEPVEKIAVIIDTANDNGEEAVIVAEGVSVEKDGSLIPVNENGDFVDAIPPRLPLEDQANVGESSSFGTALLNSGADETVDGSIPMDEENPSLKNISGETTVLAELIAETDDHTVERENVVNGDAEYAQLDEREHTGCQDANVEMDIGGTSALDTADKDSVAFDNTMDGNKTEFLNFDDDEVDEEEEDTGLPNTEDAKILENSGWSSRTRAVAKYLQDIFEESGKQRKAIPVDNLLSGKTRKEASRMFFETLVLKTRDYIQVEQEIPFDNIKIKSRVKLMKAEF